MATKNRKRVDKSVRKRTAPASKDALAFTRANYLILLIGLAIIIVGYITLRMGSITLAPFLLVLGYCVIIPIGIILRPKKQVTSQEQKIAPRR